MTRREYNEQILKEQESVEGQNGLHTEEAQH